MLNLTSYCLWGKHFSLVAKVNKEKQGYEIQSGEIFRQPFHSAYYQTQDFPDKADIALQISEGIQIPNFKFIDVFSRSKPEGNLIKNIDLQLGKKVQVLELNFDSFSSITAQKISQGKLDLTSFFDQISNKLLAKNKYQVDCVITSLMQFPIYPSKLQEFQYTKDLFYWYLHSNNLEISSDCELLVFTGEMVWSKWLNMLTISQYLQDYLNRNLKIIIDDSGFWQLLIYLAQKEPEIYKFSECFFNPQILFLANNDFLFHRKGYDVFEYHEDSALKNLLVSKERSELYDLHSSECTLDDNSVLPRYILFPKKQSKSIEKFSNNQFEHWWKPVELENNAIEFQHLSFSPMQIVEEEQLELSILRFNKAIGDQVHSADLLGVSRSDQFEILDYRHLPELEKYLVVINGQILRQGEIIALIPQFGSLLTYEIKAPCSGKIDLSQSEYGVIIIHTNKELRPFHAQFNFQVVDIQKNCKIFIKCAVENIYPFFNIGSSVSGILKTMDSEHNEEFPSIIFIDNLEEFRLNLDNIIHHRIKAIIIAKTNYFEFTKFLKKKDWELFNMNIILLEDFAGNISGIAARLKKFIGNYIFIDQGIIKIPLEQIANKFPLERSKEQQRYQIQKTVLKQGEKIHFLDYSLNNAYARIENVGLKTCLVNFQDNLLTIRKENIIYCNHE
ncbi:MAG: hypothetical protein WCJ58_02245 [bacterium]